MTRDPNLDSPARRRALANLRATTLPICHLCGHDIDMGLDRRRHPLAWTADDLHPRAHGGQAHDLGNLAPAHRVCNSTRGKRPLSDHVRAQCLAAYQRHAGGVATSTRVW